MKHAVAATAPHVTETTTAATEHAANSGFAALLENPSTWLLVSFLLFVALFIKYVLPHITSGLDKRADTIRFQLEQASRLRAQAQALLATYESERAEKLKEAEDILISAKRDAEALRARADADLKQSLERRSQQAVEKIERAEQEAVSYIRTQMVDVATQAVRDIVRTQLDNGSEDPSVDRAIRAIESQIH